MSFNRFSGRGWRRALLCVATLAALTACGGSTSQFDPFVAQRVFSFGDESSVLLADPARPGGARKYSVNFIVTVNAVDAVDCTQQPIWVQAVASLYGFVFSQCNPGGVLTPQAATFAEAGAKVADMGAQMARAGAFRDRDLVTVLMGANDVLDVYKPYENGTGAVPEDAMVDELRRRGEELANRVNELVDQGTRVILANVPDLGLSPYARAQDAISPGRAALLSRLTAAFNQQMGIKIVLDGSLIGLAVTDQMVQQIVRSPGSYGFTNATDGVCTTALPDCSNKTLVANGDAGQFLWADGTRLSYGGQARLGQLAQQRAQRNPF